MSQKYPRTPHLPWSPGITRDDLKLKSVSHLINTKLLVSEKIDGSNTCLESGGLCFSRSHSRTPTHPSFDMLKALAATISIPSGLQVFGEWVYATHSIKYDALPTYFLVFAVHDTEGKTWLSWNNVCDIASSLGLTMIAELHRYVFENELQLREITKPKQRSVYGAAEREGIVIRTAAAFTDNEFNRCVAKWVRTNHVKTDKHWSHRSNFQRNSLKNR